MKQAHKLILIYTFALLLRVALIFVAYHGDLNNNISWGTVAYERGLVGFYGSSDARDWPYSPPNQPPLTILMFAGLRLVWQEVENISWWINNRIGLFPSSFLWFWEGKGMVLLIKLPSIIADLGIGYLIYMYLCRKLKTNSKGWAILISCIWLFNPVSWYNSAVWGQTDSLVNILGLLAVMCLLEKKLIPSVMFFTVSILFKGSLIVFAPIIFFVALFQKHSFNLWMKSVCLSLLVVTLISFWFHPFIDFPVWLLNLYKNRIFPGEIGYLTANAFNFWWLVDSGKVYDSVIYLGLPARFWGFVFTSIGLSGILIWLRKNISDRKIFFSLILTALISFLFLTRVHERYLYPFFPLATILLGFIPDLWIVYIALSLTHLLNLYNLFWAPPFKPLETMLKLPIIIQTLVIINVVSFIYLLRHLRSSKL